MGSLYLIVSNMWNTIEFYRRANIINTSYRTVLRQINYISGLKDVVKKKVINGNVTWLINYQYIEEYFNRKRKSKPNVIGFNQIIEKKVRLVKSTNNVPENINQFEIELCINFKDDYD